MDNLTYQYATGDRLQKVTDASSASAGFVDVNGSTDEYTYDGNGNVLKDENKGITSITYNFIGKPTQINMSGGKYTQYTYDAAGTKLKMVNYDSTANPTTITTDYVDGFVYENTALKFFGSPEGRVVKNGSNLEYEYAIADHQGNTRTVFTSAIPTPVSVKATFEGDGGDGSSQFQNVDATKVVTSLAGNSTPSGSKVVRMNQTYKTGPAKSLKVYPGDKVDMNVWAYYEGNSGWGSTSTGVGAFITNVAAAFGGASGGGGESQSIYSGVNEALGVVGMSGNQGDTRPSAYLNYMLFDKDYKFLDMGWTVVPTSANMTKQQISISTVNVKEAGYIFVYLSYEAESNNWVYFDDFNVTHTTTNIIQYNDYYPFGLQASTSWTRETNNNDFLYNAGSELNKASGWYDLPYRNYDAALGRFMQVDPMATATHDLSTFHFGMNNPVAFNDPKGNLPISWDELNAQYAAAAAQYQAVYSYYNSWGDAFNDLNQAGSGTHYGSQVGRIKAEMALIAAVRAGDREAIKEYVAKYGEAFTGSVVFAMESEGFNYDVQVDFENGVAEGIVAMNSSALGAGFGIAFVLEGGAWSVSGQGGYSQQEGAGDPGDPTRVLGELHMIMARMFFNAPDAVSFAGGVDLGAIVGGAFQKGKIYGLNGNIRGKSTGFIDSGLGFEVGGAAGLNVSEYYFVNVSGKDYTLTMDDFAGQRLSLNAGVSAGISLGFGLSIAPVGGGWDSGMYIVSKTYAYGMGIEGLPVNANYGQTQTYK